MLAFVWKNPITKFWETNAPIVISRYILIMFNINTLTTPGINIKANFFLLNLSQSYPAINMYKKMNISIESTPEQGCPIFTTKICVMPKLGTFPENFNVASNVKLSKKYTDLATT